MAVDCLWRFDTATTTTRVMSCAASVMVTTVPGIDADELAAGAVDRLHELERRWSRFLPSSEISGLNGAGGCPRRVSADTVRLVETLVRAWHQTGGAFDPTLVGALVSLGYAASRDDATARTSLPAGIARRGCAADIAVDPVAGVVCLPRGTALDPGGLGKGLAADLVCAELLEAGASGALVEVGGDLRVLGAAPVDGAWTVAVDRGTGDMAAATVRLADGGVATSTSRFRTWTSEGRTRHHLIDPETLQPTGVEVVSCTVIAGSGATAEAFTKVAFVDGLDAALARYEQHRLAASITTGSGVHTTSAWRRFAR